MNGLKKLEWLLLLLDKIAKWIVVFLMAFMSILAFSAVIFRFVLHSPLTWSEEAARYMMVWVTYIGAGIAIKRGRHIGVTLFVNKLPATLKKACIYIADIIVILFLLVLVVLGIQLLLILRTQTSPAMRLPMVIPYFAIPFGCFYMLLHLIYLVLSRSTQLISTADIELKRLEEEEKI